MTQSNPRHRFRYKLMGIALAGVIAGIGLLKLSWRLAPPAQQAATVAASSPVDKTPGDKSDDERKADSARSLAGILLLFSMAGFGLAVLCIGWVVIDVYQARPAWKTQTKYPKKRK